MIEPSEVANKSFGPAEVVSPLTASDAAHHLYVVDDQHRILLDDRIAIGELGTSRDERSLLEIAGPRRHIFFEPSKTKIGIVTCGGLCPGINDVIRGLVMESYHRYGVRQIVGFRNGYRGCVGRNERDVVELSPECVSEIHEIGGTILGTSRGPEEPADMVANFESSDRHQLTHPDNHCRLHTPRMLTGNFRFSLNRCRTVGCDFRNTGSIPAAYLFRKLRRTQ